MVNYSKINECKQLMEKQAAANLYLQEKYVFNNALKCNKSTACRLIDMKVIPKCPLYYP